MTEGSPGASGRGVGTVAECVCVYVYGGGGIIEGFPEEATLKHD